MTAKILSLLGLSGVISPDILKKGITKLSPQLNKFFKASEANGYSAAAAISFLNSEFGGQKVQPEGTERPDETAARENERQAKTPHRLAKEAGKIAVTTALYAPLIRAGAGMAQSALGKVGAGAGIAAAQGAMQGGEPEPEPQAQEQMQPQSQEQIDPQAQGREQSSFRSALSSISDLAQIDEVVASAIEKNLANGMNARQVEAQLKASKSLLPRTLKVEKVIGKPISWIIDFITQRPEEDMQQQPQEQSASGLDAGLAEIMRLLGK